MNFEIKKIKGVILDMDGVLWRGSQAIGDLSKIFLKLKQKNLKYSFATNNSTKSIQSYKKKLLDFGIEVKEEVIFTSAKVTAEILSNRFPTKGNLYIIGEEGLIRALEDKGFKNSKEDPLAVVVGLDRNINYEKLSFAALLIQEGVKFIATNPDRSLPTPQGLVPGTGSILASINAVTNIEPEIIGKPNAAIFYAALNFLQLTPEECLVVGDRHETDIVGGHAAGIKTALVLSGVTTRDEIELLDPKPNLIAEDLHTIVNYFYDE